MSIYDKKKNTSRFEFGPWVGLLNGKSHHSVTANGGPTYYELDCFRGAIYRVCKNDLRNELESDVHVDKETDEESGRSTRA